MYSSVEPPKWYKDAQPIYHVTSDCVLQWPDEDNCNEFPVICPVHGILSRWCLKTGKCTCGPARLQQSQPDSSSGTLDAAGGDQHQSINKILQKLWGGEDIPCLLKALNSGTPADSLENRRAAFSGEQLSLTPRGPVIVNSHSLKALTECNRRKPNVDADKLPLGFVYAYLEDLGLYKEWCVVFKSQLRHMIPPDLNIEEQYKNVVVYRKRHRSGLLLNIFPKVKCFVTYIDYSQFEWRPDLNYGDQVLELYHCILERDSAGAASPPHKHDVFHLRVRPCPFLKKLTLTMGPCPLVTEKEHFKPSRHSLQSHLDMGFSINNGCVTAVAVNSPAREAGLQPDHHIIEVAGTFVAEHKDERIIHMMRQCITESPTRSVNLVVMPERVHAQLQSMQNTHHVVSNQGFHLNSWVNASPYGLKNRSQTKRIDSASSA